MRVRNAEIRSSRRNSWKTVWVPLRDERDNQGQGQSCSDLTETEGRRFPHVDVLFFSVLLQRDLCSFCTGDSSVARSNHDT